MAIANNPRRTTDTDLQQPGREHSTAGCVEAAAHAGRAFGRPVHAEAGLTNRSESVVGVCEHCTWRSAT
jgi:hypothetical protein